MSGGFFRGTSADQDTRFSNKQAKLLKSQKFPPELDHLVDVTKVKMDVIRPWIANRVTELLGFEDEVLINFIYGLLDGKDVNGKEVQIQITGFMEKNTGRFMKELWSLLLSAQKNASGVPQQFLDAKEEEIRKKKVESDRITNEIQKKKEVEQVKSKSMDGELDASKSLDDVSEPVPPNHSMLRTSDVHPKEEKDFGERNGSRDINSRRRTSVSAGQSPSSERINPKSMSKSFSNSRSYSENKSRSISISPESRRRSISPVRRYRSPRNHSISPNYKDSPRRPRSSVRRSPYSRRRSPSHSWHRSPSPRRRRSLSPRRRKSPSPWRRRSPSPRRRKSPSLIRRRSPALKRRRSPSPIRHRSPSPVRCRSPSPVRYRSSRFVRRRSPLPMHHRSPSPVRRRLPVPIRRRSPTPSRRKYASPPQSSSPSSPRRRSPLLSRKRSPPHRSPKHHRRSPLGSPGKRNRSPSPYKSHSPTFRTHRSLSRDRVIRSNGVGSRRHQVDYESERDYGRKSPIRHASHREEHKGQDSIYRQRSISLMSPQREPRDRSDVRQKKPVLSPSPERSPSQSEHSLSQKTSPSADRRSPSLSRSPMRQKQEQRTHYDKASPVRQTKDWATGDNISESDGEEQSHHARDYGNQGKRTDSPRRKILDSPYGGRRNIHKENMDHSEYSTERVTERQSGSTQGHRLESMEAKKKEERKSEKTSTRTDHHRTPTVHSARTLKESDYGPGRVEGVRSAVDHATNEQPYTKQLERDSPMKRSHKSYIREDHKVDEKQIQSHNIEDSGLDDNHDRKEYVRKPLKRVDHNNRAAHDSVSEENEKNKSENVEKRKHKRAGRHEMTSDDDTSYDSHIDERKEAKRRRKEEKRLRKEERRRRREERRRRREEKRSSKLKSKTIDTVTPPSDIENIRNDADDSDADAGRKESCPSDAEETESEQKKLEIELRKKALESLRAKKAVNP